MLFILLVVMYAVSHLVASPIRTSIPSTSYQMSSTDGIVVRSTSTGRLYDFKKRQILYKRALFATYTYDCPRSGSTHRYFSWQAEYSAAAEHDNLRMKGTKNIWHMNPITVDGRKFSTTWFGMVCEPVGLLTCTYTYRGFTQGEVSATGIAMDLVIFDPLEPAKQPAVREHCQPHNALPPETCPQHTFDAPNSSVCDIVKIEVDVVAPHP